MRVFMLIALIAAANTLQAAAPQISQLEWLAGCWRSPDGEKGTGEHWTIAAGGMMLGASRTLRNGTLAGFEFMQFRQTPAGLVFIAQPSGAPPTTFTLKQLTAEEVVFENPGHDFPQRVMYRRTANGLLARIEGQLNGKLRGIDYPMLRISCDEYFGRQP